MTNEESEAQDDNTINKETKVDKTKNSKITKNIELSMMMLMIDSDSNSTDHIGIGTCNQ